LKEKDSTMNDTEMKSRAEMHFNEKRKFLTLIRDVAGRGAKSVDPEVVSRAFVDVVQIIMDGVAFRKGSFEAVPATVVDDPEYYCELDSFSLRSQNTEEKKTKN
jgi:hypothetical protein